MKITLVRHGEAVENVSGVVLGHRDGSLTEVGKSQARQVAERLTGQDFDAIYSSDLGRCRETLEPIKDIFGDVEVIFTPELREMSFGEFEGRESKTIDWNALSGSVLSRKAPGGESGLELHSRVVEFLNYLFLKHANDNLLLVTHGGPTRNMLAAIDGLSEREMFGLDIPNTHTVSREIDKKIMKALVN